MAPLPKILQSKYFDFLYLLLLWILLQSIRVLSINTLLLHIIIGVILFLAGAIIFKIKNPKNLSEITKLYQKPTSRFGYRIVVIFSIISVLAYIFANKNTWEYSLQNSLNNSFNSLDTFVFITLVPLYEEFFFRGILFAYLIKNFTNNTKITNPRFWAVYFSALVFWLFHAPLSSNIWAAAWAQGAIPMSAGPFLLGVICAVVVIYDESLIFAIALHAIANLCAPLWANSLPNFIKAILFI